MRFKYFLYYYVCIIQISWWKTLESFEVKIEIIIPILVIATKETLHGFRNSIRCIKTPSFLACRDHIPCIANYLRAVDVCIQGAIRSKSTIARNQDRAEWIELEAVSITGGAEVPKERKIAITTSKIFDTLATHDTGSATALTEDRRELYGHEERKW